MKEVSISVRCRYRPLWRWHGARLAARLRASRLGLWLLLGTRVDWQVDGRPWEVLGVIR